jgi:translation initiation factor IF-3
MQVSQLALPGVHNLYNSMAAAIALRRFEITNEDLRDCLSTFQGVEHRLEYVRTIGKNDYINDSKATNVNAAWYALSSYERPITWILGGQGDNDYNELLEIAKKKVSKIVTFGEEANNIFNFFSEHFETYKLNDLEESILKAKEISNETGLDLVEVSPNAKPPVVKLIDYGKFKYQQQKKAAEAKKKQVTIKVKEVKFRPAVDVHDLQVKLKNVYKFLSQGDKVKMLMQFRGREMAHKHIGLDKFKEIIAGVVEETDAVVESPVKMMGNRAIAMLSPSKKAK